MLHEIFSFHFYVLSEFFARLSGLRAYSLTFGMNGCNGGQSPCILPLHPERKMLLCTLANQMSKKRSTWNMREKRSIRRRKKAPFKGFGVFILSTFCTAHNSKGIIGLVVWEMGRPTQACGARNGIMQFFRIFVEMESIIQYSQ